MDKMPTLGRQRPSRLRRWLVWALLALGAVVVAIVVRGSDSASSLAVSLDAAALSPAPAPNDGATEEPGPVLQRKVRVDLVGPLETALVAKLGSDLGRQLTQTVVRQLNWWVEVPRDLQRGDRVEVLFEERKKEEPLVLALKFKSQKLGKVLWSFRFQADGSPYAHYYQLDGSELELRLVDSPLDEYDQITSLLRDGRGHKGIDFRTPIGTPVKAPFDALVVRKTWLFASNGNSLQLRDLESRRTVMLLHLSPVPDAISVGKMVKRGEVVAQSGNTGHSFAPHLHYQLTSSNGEVLDPFAVQKVFRRSVPPAELNRFKAESKVRQHALGE